MSQAQLEMDVKAGMKPDNSENIISCLWPNCFIHATVICISALKIRH